MAQWINWGDGSDGSPNAISGTINTYAACTGTAGQAVLTTALAASAGDQVLVHQSRGTGAGTWEIVQVVSDAGSTLNLKTALVNSYGTGAQAVLIPQYTGGTLSGAVTATAWNGSTGGIIALMSNGDLTISGSLNVNGENGTSSGTSSAPGGDVSGFRGGAGSSGVGTALCGEGTIGASSAKTSANGNGGGGGAASGTSNNGGSGGGGGNGTAGTNGSNAASGGTGGTGGSSSGNAALTTMVFGGGGGGARNGSTEANGCGGGASGGGIVLIIAKNITITGSISLNGGLGGNGYRAGGGAAGGSCLIKCQVGVLGTSKISATGGSYLTSPVTPTQAGVGGVGRIRCDYFTSVSGSTTPTLSSAQDLTLKVPSGGNFIPFFM